MTVAAPPDQNYWTAETIDTTLVRINRALACLRRRPNDPIDDSIRSAAEDAGRLKLYLEQNPHACTKDGLNCCSQLVEAHVA